MSAHSEYIAPLSMPVLPCPFEKLRVRGCGKTCSMKHYEVLAGIKRCTNKTYFTTTQTRQHMMSKDMEKYDPVPQVQAMNFI